ncbi:MAG: hypothetical protein J6T64_06795, partial [Bacteroidaceae bacterium]|nr:hypothetical protein [Bacteroidaceae bacterium]
YPSAEADPLPSVSRVTQIVRKNLLVFILLVFFINVYDAIIGCKGNDISSHLQVFSVEKQSLFQLSKTVQRVK